MAGIVSDELAKVRETIAACEMQLQGLPQGDPERAPLQQRLTTLEQEKLLLMQQAQGQTQTATPPPPIRVIYPDREVSDALRRVSRLCQGEKTVGTCARVGDVVVTSMHCVFDDNGCLPDITAFGGPLELLGEDEAMDVAVFKEYQPADRSACFQLLPAACPVKVGDPVHLLSFPRAFDLDFNLDSRHSAAFDSATVVQMGDRGDAAVANFTTGMPNSSGGAVLTDTQTLAGVYLGTTYHLASPPAQADSSGSATVASSSADASPPAEPSSLLLAAASSDHVAAQLSLVNIEHKESAGVFTTAGALWRLLEKVGRAKPSDLDTAPGQFGQKRRRAARGMRGVRG